MRPRPSYYYRRSAGDILHSCINLSNLAITNPEKFSFSGLSIGDKLTLVKHNPDLAKSLNFTAGEKLEATFHLDSVTLKKAGLLASKKDIVECDDTTYAELVGKSATYFDLERYKKCGDRTRGWIFTKVPKKIIDAKEPIPKLISNDDLVELARKNSWIFIDGHITDLDKFSTDYRFWAELLKRDYNKFAKVFLDNIKSVKPASEVRSIFRSHPQLVKILDETAILNSCLTPKQWAMFIRTLKSTHTVLKDWEMSPELKETLRLDIMTDVLSGKSKLSKILQNAIGDVLAETKEEEQDEEPSKEVPA